MAHATAAAITHEEIHALRLVITHVKIPVKIIGWKSIRARKIYFDWNCIKRGRKCGFVFVSPITWSVLRGTGIRFIDMNAFHLNYAAIFESDINILTLFHLVDLTFEDWNARSRRLFQGKTLAPRMEALGIPGVIIPIFQYWSPRASPILLWHEKNQIRHTMKMLKTFACLLLATTVTAAAVAKDKKSGRRKAVVETAAKDTKNCNWRLWWFTKPKW